MVMDWIVPAVCGTGGLVTLVVEEKLVLVIKAVLYPISYNAAVPVLLSSPGDVQDMAAELMATSMILILVMADGGVMSVVCVVVKVLSPDTDWLLLKSDDFTL